MATQVADMSGHDEPSSPRTTSREDQLAAALRVNLRRRKAEVAVAKPEPPTTVEPEDGLSDSARPG